MKVPRAHRKYNWSYRWCIRYYLT